MSTSDRFWIFSRTTDIENLHKHIQDHAEEAGYTRLKTITKPMVQKTLKASDIKPFKTKYYCEKRAPKFEAKKARCSGCL